LYFETTKNNFVRKWHIVFDEEKENILAPNYEGTGGINRLWKII